MTKFVLSAAIAAIYLGLSMLVAIYATQDFLSRTFIFLPGEFVLAGGFGGPKGFYTLATVAFIAFTIITYFLWTIVSFFRAKR
jgi:hypothetical protein